MKKVLIPKVFENLLSPIAKEHHLQPVVLPDQNADTILQHAKDVDAIVSIHSVTKDLMKQMPNLKIIARTGIGYDDIDVKGASDLGIYVTNTPGANEHAVAEATVSDILILAKHLYSTSNQMRGIKSIADYHRHDLFNKIVGIIGFGHIAREVIKMLSGFGVKILIWNRHPKESKYGTFVDWKTLIRQSDYISIHIPATPQTEHCINAKTFKAMKKTAFILNFGRGSLINQHDLINALKSHEIKGAGLDVYEKEPLPKDSELRALPNVFLTPHCAGSTVESLKQMGLGAMDNVIAMLNKKSPLNPVNQVK